MYDISKNIHDFINPLYQKEIINMNIQPWHWFVFGAVLIMMELVIPTFAILWFGIAAILVAGLLWFMPTISLLAQVLVWLLLSIFCMVVWFQFISPRSKSKTDVGIGEDAILGEVGMLIEKPTIDKVGKLRFSVPILGSTEWRCRSRDDTLQVGDKVVVEDILGNDLVVSRYVHRPED